MNSHNYCIIMAGGIGSRFWPASTEKKPKQFLEILPGHKTMLRVTYERFMDIIPAENILVVTQERYADMVMESIPEIPTKNLLLEPYGRNTAPCMAYATYKLLKRDPEAVMIMTPADHIIADTEVFNATVKQALDYARGHEALITLGILPDHPDTHFGYIQAAGGAIDMDKAEPLKVKTFTEKPSEELAEVFIQSGEFLWNSGIFIWRADVIKPEMEKLMPVITNLFVGWEGAIDTIMERDFLQKAYAESLKTSIDYAVMEKTGKAWVIPAKFEWHDVGTWSSLYAYTDKKDAKGNAVIADKCLIGESDEDFIYSTEKGKLIVVKGLKDYLVINTDKVLMICPRDEENTKGVITQIALPGYEEFR